jgi:hypothetical protein
LHDRARRLQPTNILLPVLQQRKNFVIKTGCSVRRVVHRDGKAEGLTHIDASGTETFQPASIVIVVVVAEQRAPVAVVKGRSRMIRPTGRAR